MNSNPYSILKSLLTEIYLIASIFYYWFLTGTFLNPVALLLLTVVLLLIWKKNRPLGLSIGIIFLLLNLYILLALKSELSEFNETNEAYYKMMRFGLIYLGLNVMVSLLIIVKWSNFESIKSENA